MVPLRLLRQLNSHASVPDKFTSWSIPPMDVNFSFCCIVASQSWVMKDSVISQFTSQTSGPLADVADCTASVIANSLTGLL